MDEQDDKPKVTIKINGQEKQFVDKETDQREEGQDAAATYESTDESFDWMLPNERERTPYLVAKQSLMQPPNRRLPVKFKVPIILALVAIVVGTSLGLVVIRTITSEQPVTQPVEEQGVTTVVPPSEDVVATKKETMTVETYLIQGGVFSTEEAAKDVQKLIHEKKLPAEIFQVGQQYYLFLGVAENLQASKELALFYKTEEIDMFWKDIEFTTKLAKNDQKVENVLSIYAALANLSATKLRQVDSSVDINEVSKQVADLQLAEQPELKRSLTEVVELLQNDKPQAAQEKLLMFLKEIVE